MNYLKIMLSQQEIDSIKTELERLFVLQDKPLPENKKSIFMQEIEDAGIPYAAIVSGIRALVSEDLKTIKLNTIIQAVKRFVVFDGKKTNCFRCLGGGMVSLVDEKFRRFAFACRCEAGRGYQELAQWNGQVEQDHNGQTFRLYEAEILGDKYTGWLETHGMIEKPIKEMSWA